MSLRVRHPTASQGFNGTNWNELTLEMMAT
jgi:hypothetical protein